MLNHMLVRLGYRNELFDRPWCLIALWESFISIKSPQPTIWHGLGFLTIGCHLSPKWWAKIQILYLSFYTVMAHDSWDNIGNKLIRSEICFFFKRFCLVFLYSWALCTDPVSEISLPWKIYSAIAYRVPGLKVGLVIFDQIIRPQFVMSSFLPTECIFKWYTLI